MNYKWLIPFAFVIVSAPAAALAQGTSTGADVDGDGADEEATTTTMAPAEALPTPKSDDDPKPPVASPGPPDGAIVRQAGIGGATAYGRAGVLELGGAAGFTAANNLTQASLTPSIGWFVADNLQLSGHLGFTYVSAQEQDATMFSMLVEPSYHLPFNQSVFGFLGLGIGGAHVEGPGLGFAMAPRLGANIMVGRSGILTPALAWQYTTHDSMDSPNGQILAVSSALSANIGYTVMW